MSRLPRVLSTVAVTVGVTAGLSFGVTPSASAATPPVGVPVEAIVTETTTEDINLTAVQSPELLERLADRAEAGPVRLAGSDRYGTAVRISKRAFPKTSSTVYLVGGNDTDVALAAGALTDGPVLLVPETGAVPASVLAEISRLSPSEVVALGAALPAGTVTAAAQGAAVSRIGTSDVYETTAAIARRAFPDGAATVYVARVGGSADAVSGGSLSNGPVVPVPASGSAPAAVKNLVNALSPQRVVGLGGPAAITQSTLVSAAGSRATDRIAGADRYTTSSKVAQAAFPHGAPVAYLAGGTRFADAVAGGTLRDGPVLLTPPAYAKDLTQTVSDALTTLGVRNLGALGGVAAAPDAAITAVGAKVPTASITSLPAYVIAPAPVAAPTPTPTASPSPTATPSPTPPYTPPPTYPPTPTYTPEAPRVTPVAETCEQVVASFKPIPMDSRYTISCAPGFGSNQTLGVTTTYIGADSGDLIKGTVKIRSDLTGNVLRAVIAHELAHAWSYAHLSSATRDAFAKYTGVPSWDSTVGYDASPPEVWARTQATCVGWPDGYGRKQLTCNELRPFGWS